MTLNPNAFFDVEDETFIGTAAARGPWSPDHCHAGPVIGLIARAAERAQDDDKLLIRLSVDLLSPVPMAGIRLSTEVTKSGRNVGMSETTVTDVSGRVCAIGRSLSIREVDLGEVPTAPSETLRFEDAEPGLFPGAKDRALPLFTSFVEVAYPPGQTTENGPKTIWMKTLPIFEDEQPSPFQRLCGIADCGNGISKNAEISEYAFMNTDITIVRHRVSQSEWLATETRSDWNSVGVGLSTSVIQDDDGPIASVLQPLLLRRQAP